MVDSSPVENSAAAPTDETDKAIALALNIAIAANFANCVLVILMNTPKSVRQAILASATTYKRRSRIVAYAHCPEDSRFLKKQATRFLGNWQCSHLQKLLQSRAIMVSIQYYGYERARHLVHNGTQTTY